MVVAVGGGAIGGLLSGYLSAEVEDFVLADPWTEHIEKIRGAGLEIGGARGERRFHPRVVELSRLPVEVDRIDVVFVCVKSQDTASAADVFGGRLTEDATVVSVQNGMNDELLAARFGRHRVVAAVCEIAGRVDGPGRIVETRAGGGFVIGDLDGRPTERVTKVARLMNSCAPTTVSTNVVGIRWSKLIWNSMINPVSALTGLGSGAVILDPDIRRLCMEVGAEGVAVSRAAGVQLEPLTMMGIDPRAFDRTSGDRVAVEESLVARYANQLDKRPSMAQDVARGRPTEIDHLNGYLVRRGRELSVDTPLNAELVGLVHRVERAELVSGVSAIRHLLHRP